MAIHIKIHINTYIYICIHSINKCLVKEQILSDTHTYGIS